MQVAAVSAGIVEDTPLLDLCYREDSAAQADMNLVMNHRGEFIELQGTGEGRAFAKRELETLTDYGRAGVRALMRAQREALRGRGALLLPLPRVALASGNAHKVRELQALLGGVCELVSMKDAGFAGDIDETGDTFAQNAALKAEAVMRATGLPALADDSGLAVEALDGAPGVRSARYAGAHGDDGANNRLLLQNMTGVTDRMCKFVCAMALALPAEKTRVVTGECHGELLAAPRGEHGFGYDPLFLYETGQTFAEMPEKQKNDVSHRANAAKLMHDVLKELL
jgi:XTP/dITP diphosphohydrolase